MRVWQTRQGIEAGRVVRIVRTHPLKAFFGLTFLLSWLIWVPLLLAHLSVLSWKVPEGLVLLGQLRGNLVFTLLLCGLLGVGAALLAIPAQTTIQEDTPENQRGRVFGLQNNLINIALSLPLVLAGTVVSRYGLLPVLWGLAAIAAVAALSERPWRSS